MTRSLVAIFQTIYSGAFMPIIKLTQIFINKEAHRADY